MLRSDIRNLPLEEQRRKFLKEQIDQDNLLSEQIQRQRQYEFYMSQMQSKGGSSGGFSGQANDGPLSGATVISNVGTTTTNNLGIFTLPETPSGEITVTGGTDSITGVAFTGELKGFPQFKTISPLTTLAFHLKEEDTSLTADTAIDLLFVSSSTLFGVELDVADKDIMLKKDYIAESILANNQKAIAAQSIATYLESVTSVVASAVEGADSTNFTLNSAKIEGYKSIARQIRDAGTRKSELNAATLFDKVKLPNGSDWTGGLTGSLGFLERDVIGTNLNNVKSQLGTLSRSEAFTTNYLTTQIQAINRGVKEDYAVEADKLAKGQTARFDNVDVMVGKSTGSLAQIEKGKANENTRAEGEKPETFYTLGAMTFTQIAANGDTTTLSGDDTAGNMRAIAARSNAFTSIDALGKYIIKPDRDSLSLDKIRNYNARLGDVTAKQTTVSPENAEANKLIQLTLNGRTLQITALTLVDAPVAGHIFSTGTYTLSMAESRVTQRLSIATEEGVSTLSFGEIRGLNISEGITVVRNLSDNTKFVVTVNGSAVTPDGGNTFSGSGNGSSLTFTFNSTLYTLLYTT